VPEQTNAAAAPADDWVVPKGSMLERAHAAIEDSSVGRVQRAVLEGEKQGFGSEPLGIVGGSPTDQALTRLGIFHEPGKGYVGPQGTVQLLDEAILRPSAVAADAFFRALSAAGSGVAAGAGQVAREFGQSEPQVRKLTGDIQTGEELAVMSHIPEAGLLESGRTVGAPAFEKVQASPEQIEDFLAQAARAPNAPTPPPSKTRQDIDEFLRQREAREQGQAAPAGTPQLPPPDDWTVPAEQAAPAPQPAAPSGGALDTLFPSLDEPGRASPPPAQEVADDRQNGVGLPGEVGARQEPVQSQSVEGPSGAPAGAGGILQARAQEGAPAPANQTSTSAVGPHTLKALLDDPRSADEISAIAAAEHGVSDAVEAHAIADASSPTNQMVVDNQTGVNPQPAVEDWQAGVEAAAPAGTRDDPVALYAPTDVHAGAEITATPTQGQAEAGNYRKRHVEWQGLDLTVETEAGAARTGTGPGGVPWSVTLQNPYGYIKGTKGRDGEQIDAYLGPEPASPHVFVVDQINPDSGRFDEHKALIGFADEQSAIAGYVAGFSDGSGQGRLGAITALTVEGFKDWLSKGVRRNPTAYSDPVRAIEGAANEAGMNLTDAEAEAAAHAKKVSNADPTEALLTVVDHQGLAAVDGAIETAKTEGLTDAWTAHGATESEAGAGIAPAGERPAEPESAGAEGISPASVEPHGGEQAGSAGEPSVASKPAAPVPEPEAAPVTRDEAPAEPKIVEAVTVAYLKDVTKRVPSMGAGDRTRAREFIDTMLSNMDSNGKKLAEHCVETGGKFSLRG
jgi:hypothetical protein